MAAGRTGSVCYIREVWTAADALSYPFGGFVKGLLLTGRRRTSVATVRRSEIDRAARTWKPADGTDNKQAPELPLFTALEGLLDSVLRSDDGPDKDANHVFRSCTADVPINSFTAIKARRRSFRGRARPASPVLEEGG